MFPVPDQYYAGPSNNVTSIVHTTAINTEKKPSPIQFITTKTQECYTPFKINIAKPVIPEQDFPLEVDPGLTKSIKIMRFLGPFSPRKLLIQSAFPVQLANNAMQTWSDACANYRSMPQQGFTGIKGTVFPRFSPRADVTLPVGYVPPQGDKPVILFSPGASGRLTDYASFILELHQQGYGILAYQFGLLDDQNNYYLEKFPSFKKMDRRLTEDLDKLSQALAQGTLTTPEGKVIPPVSFQKQVLIGHSTGGIISSTLMAHYPARDYPALLLVASPLSFQKAFINLMENHVDSKVYARTPKNWASSSLGNAFNLNQSIRKISSPIYFIQGAKDTLVRRDIYNEFYKTDSPFSSKIKDFVCISNATHAGILSEINGISYGKIVAEDIHEILRKQNLAGSN